MSINYEKLREMYNEIKTEKEKLYENFIKLNQENFELKRELLATKKNLDLNSNLINKNPKNFGKENNIESEINLRINSTNTSSSERVLNFNFKDSERNTYNSDHHQDFNIENNINKNNNNNGKKSSDYITDYSDALDRAASFNRIYDLGANFIDDLKRPNNIYANKNLNESNRNNKYNEYHDKDIGNGIGNCIGRNENDKDNYLKKEENFAFDKNNNNKNNNIDIKLDMNNCSTKNNKWNTNQPDYNLDVKGLSNMDLLKKNFIPNNFMIKLNTNSNSNDNDKQSVENKLEKDLSKSDLSVDHSENKVENELNTDSKSQLLIAIKAMSPNKNEINKKFSKPPYSKVKFFPFIQHQFYTL